MLCCVLCRSGVRVGRRTGSKQAGSRAAHTSQSSRVPCGVRARRRVRGRGVGVGWGGGLDQRGTLSVTNLVARVC